jgi:hypothetical protein
VSRIEHIGRATLYLGRCEDVLPTLGAVDAVVMDPPYVLSEAGPGDSHFGMSLNKFDSDDYKRIVSGFDLAIFDALPCSPLNLFCFCSNKQVSQIMAYHEERGRATTLCVWHKTNAAPFANGVWRGDIEYCVHVRESGAVFVGNASEKKKVWEHPLVQDGEHPTVKPLPIIKKQIAICSNKEQVILDPFMGSGTSGVAACSMERNYIGVECELKYFDLACRRIEQAHKQGDFFGYGEAA